jgi:uncharacterized protein YbbC (DUF1343 family)
LPTFEHAYVYLGTVLFEGVNISEGRGTSDPFLTLGAPGTVLKSTHIAQLRRSYSGVNIEQISFVPRSMPGKAPNPDFEGERCHGVEIQVTDPDKFDPVALGVDLLQIMIEATPEATLTDYIQNLSGIDKSTLRDQLSNQSYRKEWGEVAEQFAERRSEYLLYD